MMMTPELIAAYRRTSYRVDLPGGSLCLRIGERSEALDRVLETHGARSWAFVTAHNPGSQQLPAEENGAREQKLNERLRERGYRYFAGAGIGDDGAWPEERSVLVLEMGREEARRIGREFGQVAVVVGARGGAPELVACDSGGASGG